MIPGDLCGIETHVLFFACGEYGDKSLESPPVPQPTHRFRASCLKCFWYHSPRDLAARRKRGGAADFCKCTQIMICKLIGRAGDIE